MDQKVYFKKYNSTFVKFKTLNSKALKEIREYLSYRSSNYHQKYKKIEKICMVYQNCFIPIGLAYQTIEFMKNRGYKVLYDSRIFEKNNIEREDVEKFIKLLKLRLEPHYYQMDAIYKVMKNKRHLLLSPTSSGKSLIAAIIMMMYVLLRKDKTQKILFVVPSKNLVEQMYYDMVDYFRDNKDVDISNIVQRIHGEIPEKRRDLSKPVILTTWQSSKRTSFDFQKEFSTDFLQSVGMLIYDEAHLSKSKVSRHICNSCFNADYRIGMTGTLFDEEDDAGFLNNQRIKGMFGEIYKTISTREMIDAGFAADIYIYHLLFNFGVKERKGYHEEIEMIKDHKGYLNYMVSFIGNLKKYNTLCLYKSLKHGETLKRMLEAMFPNKKIVMINYAVSAEQREMIRRLMERNRNVILLGTYATVSTGFSVKNLKYCVFTESMKAKIKCVQAIGRLLRKHSDIERTLLFDFVPVVEYKTRDGYMYDHYKHRLRYFQKEQHNYEIKEIPDEHWKNK